MNNKIFQLILVLLALSLVGNLYLFVEIRRYEQAWLSQFIATSDIEAILKASGVDTSFENIESVAVGRFGAGVEVIDVGESYESDRRALKVNDSILLFKGGHYYGSKANLPGH